MSRTNKIFHGIFLVNKESGVTSHDVVARMRKILGTSAVGHSGTLDPIANGLLVLLVGEATKLSQYILEGDKAYKLEMQLGIQTDTFDITGEIIKEQIADIKTETLMELLPEFSGEKEWQVPVHSAVKVKGKKLYEYARNEQFVETPRKIMKFWDVQFLVRNENKIQIHLHCSKGSYIRTWINEFGLRLGCGAAMSGLTRTKSIPYSLEQASTLDEIDLKIKSSQDMSCFIPLGNALPNVKKIKIKGQDQRLLKNGQISHDLKLKLIQSCDPQTDRLIFVTSYDSDPLALIGFQEGVGFSIRRVFHFDVIS